jgi:hypothetical protein
MFVMALTLLLLLRLRGKMQFVMILTYYHYCLVQ